MTSEIKIEKGVPLPENGATRWPFGAMDIGDSVFSPDAKIVSASHSWASINRKKFTTRKVDGGFRVWRIA